MAITTLLIIVVYCFLCVLSYSVDLQNKPVKSLLHFTDAGTEAVRQVKYLYNHTASATG